MPKSKLVSWNLTRAQIQKRRKFCADPDVHGITCVCLSVVNQRDRNDRVADVITALHRSRMAVYKLSCTVDPGHVPLLDYLRDLERRLDTESSALVTRLEEESGG